MVSVRFEDNAIFILIASASFTASDLEVLKMVKMRQALSCRKYRMCLMIRFVKRKSTEIFHYCYRYAQIK